MIVLAEWAATDLTDNLVRHLGVPQGDLHNDTLHRPVFLSRVLGLGVILWISARLVSHNRLSVNPTLLISTSPYH